MKNIIIVLPIIGLLVSCAALEEITGVQGIKSMEFQGNTYDCVDDPADPTIEHCKIDIPDKDISTTIVRKKK